MTQSRVNPVLAIDPGKMTGVAFLKWSPQTNLVVTTLTAELEILGDNPQHATMLRSIIRGWRETTTGDYPTRVVVERFTITPDTGKKSAEAKTALETIGAVKLMCLEEGYPLGAIHFQSPGEAKAGWPNPKLKRCGLWHRGGAGHAMDALRHAATYLVSQGWSDPRMFD